MPYTEVTGGTINISKVSPMQGSRAGQRVVTTGGTAVRLSATSIPLPFGRILIKALSGNSGQIYVGFDDQVAAGNGFELSKGDYLDWSVADVNEIWINASVDTQGVCWVGA